MLASHPSARCSLTSFQSPSRRGQHHCARSHTTTKPEVCFSPLREGDNIIAVSRQRPDRRRLCFSPLREGDNIIAYAMSGLSLKPTLVSVPFAKGTTSLLPDKLCALRHGRLFQSPSRRGQHHCPAADPAASPATSRFSPLREGDNIIASADVAQRRVE